jgi:predicted dehydrogenase
VNALVMGAGHMGSLHAKVLRDLGHEVVTVDPNAPADFETLDQAAMEFWPFDIAAIAAPIGELMGATLALAGTHRLLVEKPFAPDVHQARTLAAVLNGAGGRVCVGFVERFNPVVRRLYRDIDDLGAPVGAKFTRWSDRPSPDTDTDLRLHDVDLAYHLGLFDGVEYDTRADAGEKRRRIEVFYDTGQRLEVDLMAHDQSPLHAMWHTFLSGRGAYPKPVDAIRAHRMLQPDLMAA